MLKLSDFKFLRRYAMCFDKNYFVYGLLSFFAAVFCWFVLKNTDAAHFFTGLGILGLIAQILSQDKSDNNRELHERIDDCYRSQHDCDQEINRRIDDIEFSKKK
jgi:hypothetical protein